MILTFVDVLPNIYLGIAITFSTFFLLQSVLTLFGNIDDLGSDSDMDSSMDFDEDMDFDVDEDLDMDEDFGISEDFDEDMSVRLAQSSTPFHLFTLRAILGFFILFGWTGFIMSNNGYLAFVTLFFSIIAGIIAMFAVSYLVYMIYKLAQDGTLNFNDSIGVEGKVYLEIPGRGNGTGKVQLIVGGALKTLDAISTDSAIHSGKKVRVVGLEKELLIVEEIIERKE